MKRFLPYIPVSLLSIYVILCFFRVPQLADALIIVTIGSIYAFNQWLDSKQPMKSELSPDMLKKMQTVEDLRLQREINGLQLDITRYASQHTALNQPNKPISF